MVVSVFSDDKRKFTENNLFDILSNPENEKEYPIPKRWKKLEVINKGKVEGRLIGGNLSIVISTLGTPYEIETKNKIVFLEDIFYLVAYLYFLYIQISLDQIAPITQYHVYRSNNRNVERSYLH